MIFSFSNELTCLPQTDIFFCRTL